MVRPIANYKVGPAPGSVIACGKLPALRILILEPVNNVAVPQGQIVVFVRAYDRQDPIEISGVGDNVIKLCFLRNREADREQCPGDPGCPPDEKRCRRGLKPATLPRILESGGTSED